MDIQFYIEKYIYRLLIKIKCDVNDRKNSMSGCAKKGKDLKKVGEPLIVLSVGFITMYGCIMN